MDLTVIQTRVCIFLTRFYSFLLCAPRFQVACISMRHFPIVTEFKCKALRARPGIENQNVRDIKPVESHFCY